MIIANGELKKHSDSLIIETIEEIIGIFNKRKIIYTIVDSTILIATLTIFGFYIGIFFSIQSDIEKLSISLFLNWTTVITAISLGIIYILHFIFNINKK